MKTRSKKNLILLPKICPNKTPEIPNSNIKTKYKVIKRLAITSIIFIETYTVAFSLTIKFLSGIHDIAPNKDEIPINIIYIELSEESNMKIEIELE